MDYTNFRNIINNLDKKKLEQIKGEVLGKFAKDDADNLYKIPADILLLYIYLKVHKINYYDNKILVYGAGKMAKKHVPSIAKTVNIEAIWDAYSKDSTIADIAITKPFSMSLDKNILVVVFIDDAEIRKNIIKLLNDNNFFETIYFRDYLKIVSAFLKMDEMKIQINKAVCSVIENIENTFFYLKSELNPVLFSVIDNSIDDTELFKRFKLIDKGLFVQKIFDELVQNSIEKKDVENVAESINTKINSGNLKEAIVAIEEALKIILRNGAKTKERSIRMAGDEPYDGFAARCALSTIINMICDDEDKIKLLRYIKTLSSENIVILSLESELLLNEGKLDEALAVSRQAVALDSNNLLADETFCGIAYACKENGIVIEEPLPDYDLSERFCYSGLSFAWYGGKRENGNAKFEPCFRSWQCAARPAGDFWVGEEWKEFRKSVTDGSFKYCQKNQCTNLVSGWLPKKSDVTEETLLRIFDGDLEVIPDLEEMHFSYDAHCNLMCPSCRTEFITNTKETHEEFDEFYKNQLQQYVKKVKHLCLSGCGEALISPHSRKILESVSPAKYPELEIELRTNMTMLNEKTWKDLGDGRKCIKHIAASIDSCTKENFEKLRYPAKWDTVYDNLKFVQKLRNDGEIDMFEFHVVAQRDNVEELLDIVKLAISLDADCITFSRIVNWQNMSDKLYHEVNPFWIDHPLHSKLLEQWNAIIKLRDDIENGRCDLVRKKFYINLHFVPDPNESYKEIRMGKIRIR